MGCAPLHVHSHTDPDTHVHKETTRNTPWGGAQCQGMAGGKGEGSSGGIRARGQVVLTQDCGSREFSSASHSLWPPF